MKKILVFLFFALLVVSCSKESYLGDNEKEEVQSDNCSLTLLKFDPLHNPGLKVSVNGIINSNVIYVTVNDGVNLSQLVPTFGIDAKATAKVGDKVIESAKSRFYSCCPEWQKEKLSGPGTAWKCNCGYQGL